MGSVLSAAMSAMDVAMWDILARSLDLPIHQLLGGKVRDKVKVFANVSGNTLEERARSAADQVAKGFLSLRTLPFFPGWAARTRHSRAPGRQRGGTSPDETYRRPSPCRTAA